MRRKSRLKRMNRQKGRELTVFNVSNPPNLFHFYSGRLILRTRIPPPGVFQLGIAKAITEGQAGIARVVALRKVEQYIGVIDKNVLFLRVQYVAHRE